MIDLFVMAATISRVQASIDAKGFDGAALEIDILLPPRQPIRWSKTNPATVQLRVRDGTDSKSRGACVIVVAEGTTKKTVLQVELMYDYYQRARCQAWVERVDERTIRVSASAFPRNGDEDDAPMLGVALVQRIAAGQFKRLKHWRGPEWEEAEAPPWVFGEVASLHSLVGAKGGKQQGSKSARLRWDEDHFRSRVYGKIKSKGLKKGTITIDYAVSAAEFRSVSSNFWDASYDRTTWIIVLSNAFQTAQKLLADNPSANEIVWNWVNPNYKRDEYGNLITPTRYSSIARATLLRAKSKKLNWDYIRGDGYKGYPIELRKYLSSARATVPTSLPAF
jgi:hypothetical protein